LKAEWLALAVSALEADWAWMFVVLAADRWSRGGWLGIACPGEGVHAVPWALSNSFQECELFVLSG
jgi:hypothetical protein